MFTWLSSHIHEILTKVLSLTWSDLHRGSIEVIYLLLVLSAIVGWRVAYHKSRLRDLARHFEREEEATWIHRYQGLWRTQRWWVLSAVIDRWLRGVIPGDGMWMPDKAESLRRKEDKRALRELVRMGIFPLFIQDGGFGTRQEKGWRWGSLGWPEWGTYVQSKRRGVFEFLVPGARGWNIDEADVGNEDEKERRKVDERYFDFILSLVRNKYIRRETRWRVIITQPGEQVYLSDEPPDARVPYEVGAKSRFQMALPFMSDKILRPGEGLRHSPLSSYVDYESAYWITRLPWPHVRIEAADSEPCELDKDILVIAEGFKLGRGWNEVMAQKDLRREFREHGIDPFELL
ncbi:hypothetical protein N0V90_004223 [Kalmusia sp. IMI 367209]|nr:hypothetical protein N0V90_004223 [Kalmusia sp. IMI 367209]